MFWEMQGGDVRHEPQPPRRGAPTGRSRGTEDFDSDGDADILWRHDDGTVVTWEMEDGALFRTESFGQVSNGWQIRGTGEFDLV